ncbi:antibiotic biosynthesis monooxygenase [Novosphingobium rosa]|uniref:antibiotic biosynthesis monooxygenase n=1 Tax=Novosphingobium rosa TaxID=76978 RepID=UPI00082FB624|nr:antibiotic biosynthesis monooxygenase [Novosphingobium rosa]
MPTTPQASFASMPQPTVFIVNVIHAHPGKQDEAFAIIKDVVRHASGKPGFLWSNLSRSTNGKTVVNIEAIADPDRVGAFFGDPVFVEKFARLDAVSTSEFHTYRVGELIFPASAEALAS